MASIRKRTNWVVVGQPGEDKPPTFDTKKQALAHQAALLERGVATQVRPGSRVSYEARIRCRHAPPLTKTFRKKEDANNWVKAREGEITKRELVDYGQADRTTLGELLKKYDGKIAHKPASDPDRTRIRMLRAHDIALYSMSALRPEHVVRYRDERAKAVKPMTVKKELELLARVIGLAGREWGIYLPLNPASGKHVSRPKEMDSDRRTRRLGEAPRAVAARAKPSSASFEVEEDSFGEELTRLAHSEQQALLRALRYASDIVRAYLPSIGPRLSR